MTLEEPFPLTALVRENGVHIERRFVAIVLHAQGKAGNGAIGSLFLGVLVPGTRPPAIEQRPEAANRGARCGRIAADGAVHGAKLIHLHPT